MNIKNLIGEILIQIKIKRTTEGKIITDFAIKALKSILDDSKNHDSPAIICKNCGLISSVLLNEDGCVNCGGLDFNDKIYEKHI